MRAPCSISSQEIEGQCGKTSFMLHLARETEGPPSDLSAMHLLSDYTPGSQPETSSGLYGRAHLNTDTTAEAAPIAISITAN